MDALGLYSVGEPIFNTFAADVMIRHQHPPAHPSAASFQTAGLLTSLFVVLVLPSLFVTTVNAIDCFKCVSVNGENPACEDPFHNNFTSDLLESPCMGGRKNRNGLFPATACLKLAGRYADGNYEKMVIRTCALDSGTLTLDTELVRMSHCGSFVLDGRYVNGCLQSCDDGDGCNRAPDRSSWLRMAAASVTISVVLSIPLDIFR